MKRECAEAVWAKKPTTAADLVAAVVDWESIYGSASKLWNDHHKYYHRQQHQSQLKQQFDHSDQIKSPQPAQRRDQSRLQQQIGQQHQFGERQSVGRSRQDQGQADVTTVEKLDISNTIVLNQRFREGFTRLNYIFLMTCGP